MEFVHECVINGDDGFFHPTFWRWENLRAVEISSRICGRSRMQGVDVADPSLLLFQTCKGNMLRGGLGSENFLHEAEVLLLRCRW